MTKMAALGIDRLSVEDRLGLIEEIWDSLPTALGPAEVPDWHLAILAERVAAADADPNRARPWREALADLGSKP